jgi:hypothetical protein
MPTKQEVIENLNWTTARVSDRVWTISVGVIGVSMSYIIEASSEGEPFLAPERVAIPAGLALIALCLDLVQYVAAHRQNMDLLRRMEAQGLTDARFDTGSAMRRLRTAAYRGKISLCAAAGLWLVLVSGVRVVQVMRGG